MVYALAWEERLHLHIARQHVMGSDTGAVGSRTVQNEFGAVATAPSAPLERSLKSRASRKSKNVSLVVLGAVLGLAVSLGQVFAGSSRRKSALAIVQRDGILDEAVALPISEAENGNTPILMRAKEAPVEDLRTQGVRLREQNASLEEQVNDLTFERDAWRNETLRLYGELEAVCEIIGGVQAAEREHTQIGSHREASVAPNNREDRSI